MIDYLRRFEKLQQFLSELGGSVVGSKKFHKLVYLAEEAGTDLEQDFIFHYYGVFSPSLASDLDRFQRMGLITQKENGGQTVTSLVNKPNSSLKPAISENGVKLAKILKDEEPRMLEVLSTIVYLNRCGYEDDELLERLKNLKGQHSGFFSGAKQFAKQYFNIEVKTAATV